MPTPPPSMPCVVVDANSDGASRIVVVSVDDWHAMETRIRSAPARYAVTGCDGRSWSPSQATPLPISKTKPESRRKRRRSG